MNLPMLCQKKTMMCVVEIYEKRVTIERFGFFLLERATTTCSEDDVSQNLESELAIQSVCARMLS